TTPSGLQYEITKEAPADARVAKRGNMVTVHYTGWLYDNGKKGNKFDSSLDRDKPFSFRLGAGNVILGWEEGVEGMKVGEIRMLTIPANLGYGASGVGPIPGNATLFFQVELLDVK